jgi:putative membrane protein
MKSIGWICACALALLSVASCDQDDDSSVTVNHDLDAIDKMFVENAALSSMTEIEFGSLANSRGADSLVRAYGQTMVTEHTVALNELEEISGNYTNVDWPQSLDSTHQQIKQQLLMLGETEFDSVYLRSQVNDHQTALSLFQNESSNGQNHELKNYALKYLPQVEKHLTQADSMYRKFTIPRDPEENN